MISRNKIAEIINICGNNLWCADYLRYVLRETEGLDEAGYKNWLRMTLDGDRDAAQNVVLEAFNNEFNNTYEDVYAEIDYGSFWTLLDEITIHDNLLNWLDDSMGHNCEDWCDLLYRPDFSEDYPYLFGTIGEIIGRDLPDLLA